MGVFRRRTATCVVMAAAVGLLLGGTPAAAVPEGPEYPSAEWFAREAQNYAKTQEEPAAQASSPEFLARWQEQSTANIAEYRMREHHNGEYYDSRGNLCASWGQQCVGEPFLYPGVDDFYEDEGEVVPVSYYDDGGALLSGRVWAPRDADPEASLPGVVIETGSVQAPETLYWWFAQTLVRNGYVVMTYDVRGQGRSDNETPDGEEGTNFNPDVFVTNLVDSVDFLRSTPAAPYGHNRTYADQRPGAELAAHNPFWELLDRDRIGIVGHSLGATGVSVVQGLEPWIGEGDANPVDVAVAWDNLSAGSTSGSGSSSVSFEVVPRVPAMGQAGDYFLTPMPHEEPPDPEGEKEGFSKWQETGVPAYQIVVQGGTHYEWSYLPDFPSTAWGRPWSGDEGWGNPMVEHYSLAWLDRWLKQPDERGHADADARLLDDASWCERLSFYSRSAREFPDRDGRTHHTEDIRADCLDAAGSDDAPPEDDRPATDDRPADAAPEPSQGRLPDTGGGMPAAGALLAAAAGWLTAAFAGGVSPGRSRRRR